MSRLACVVLVFQGDGYQGGDHILLGAAEAAVPRCGRSVRRLSPRRRRPGRRGSSLADARQTPSGQIEAGCTVPSEPATLAALRCTRGAEPQGVCEGRLP